MLGPKTDNSVTDSQNVNQVGHNSGTMNIGLTFEQHERNVRERIAELRADLERAHGAERTLLQAQVDAAVASLSNLQADYQKTLAELADLKATLARYDNVLDRTKHAAADAALDRGDLSLAKALLKELSATARARREDASKEEAELEFKLGEIAETEIRWHDAATHFATAASLNPAFDTLHKAREFAWRAGDYAAAFRFGEDLLKWAESQGSQAQLAMALNEHALTLDAQGQYGQAEGLYRHALVIGAATIGTAHAAYATRLNNLAGVVQLQGRYAEAEGLYRQALEIDTATVGTAHPDYAIDLNNLALVVLEQGRHAEAEGLFRQALEIGAATIGTAHPDYGTHLNNLAGVVQAQGRHAEAEGLFRQALEIDAATIGTAHPDYAIRMNNLALVVEAQGRYAEAEGLYWQALAIFRGKLGDNHPNTCTVAQNLLSLLQTHFPDDPEIPALQALLADTP